jgi:hypothetical protein
MSSTEGQPLQNQPTPEPPVAPTQPIPAAPGSAGGGQPPPAAPAPQPVPAPAPGQPPYAVWPAGWPGTAAPAQPRRHSAWIGTMTPLTAGILALVLVLAGFGLGVVVGWQHDGHGTQRVVFEPGQRRFDQGQRPFGPGQGPFFNGPDRQRQPAPTPTPAPSSSS